jgi:predicted N-acetyltransferase YhbS
VRKIKKLTKDQLTSALRIAAKAYPMMQVNTEQQIAELDAKLQQDFNSDGREWFGLFEDNTHLGSMLLFDFCMNYYGKDIKAKGIGFVAVEFLHKKQKVCKEMLHWYLEHSIKQQYPMAMLYSFRPDFYKKMGFGFGTKCYKYVSSPDRLPRFSDAFPMQYLGEADKDDVIAFYNALYNKHHGMIRKREKDIEAMLKSQGTYFVGYKEQGQLLSMLSFRLKADDSTNQATHMMLELLFTCPNGLKAALNFLNSQADQVSRMEFSTLYPDLFYSFGDIRNLDNRQLREPGYHHVYDTGMGIMYRSLNHAQLLLERPSMLDGMRIRFCLKDDFITGKANEFTVQWIAGKASMAKGAKHDLQLSMGVAEYSAWMMNAVDFSTLHQYGLLNCSKENLLPEIDRAFYYQQKPLCLERF